MSSYFHVKRLSKKEESELYNDWDNIETKKKVFESNIPLAIYICEKFYDTISIHEGFFSNEDLQQVALIGLWKAIINFKPSMNTKLSTFAGKCIENEIGMELRKLKRKIHNAIAYSFENEIPGTDIGGKDSLKIKDVLVDNSDYINNGDKLYDMVEEVLSELSYRDRCIFILYYFENENQLEISKRFELSQSYVSRILKECNKRVSEYIVDRL